jgi:hypothetical protein
MATKLIRSGTLSKRQCALCTSLNIEVSKRLEARWQLSTNFSRRKRRLRQTLSYSLRTTLNLRSKAQYELHFKKWEFRKNRTKDDWKIVAQKLRKRKREHKESEVYIDGNLIKSKKVRKETSRYGSMPATTEMQLQGNHIRVISNLRSSL